MNTVQDIETAIEKLDDSALRQLAGWFEDFVAEKWECKFAADALAGKLDKLGAAADRAFDEGKCRPL